MAWACKSTGAGSERGELETKRVGRMPSRAPDMALSPGRTSAALPWWGRPSTRHASGAGLFLCARCVSRLAADARRDPLALASDMLSGKNHMLRMTFGGPLRDNI
eukprot:2923888-Alexandrium_andersonii.AAC.1